MQLSPDEIAQFIQLYSSLLLHTNRVLGILPKAKSTARFSSLAAEARHEIREGLYNNPEVIDSYVQRKAKQLKSAELQILRDWQENYIYGDFFIFRYLKKYTVFLETEKPFKAYGVYYLNDSFQDLLGTELPRYVTTALLPFHGKIVCDGLFLAKNSQLSHLDCLELNTRYAEFKKEFGIIETLD